MEPQVLLFIVFLLWLGGSVLVGIASKRKGGSFNGEFVISLLISPLVGGLIVLLRPPSTKAMKQRMVESGGIREVFSKLVMGKTRPQVKELLGKPDCAFDLKTTPIWNYNKRMWNPDTEKVQTGVWVHFVEEVVTEVTYFPPS
jgi:hypothetical protein